MAVALEDSYDDAQLAAAVRQIMLSGSDADYMDQLIPAIKDACVQRREDGLMVQLGRFSEAKESEIEHICNANHQGFVQSVEQVLHVRQDTVRLTTEILNLNQSIHRSTENLASKKKALVDSRGTRQNIDEATQALHLSLEVLGLANQVHELLHAKKNYAALRTLDELHNVHLKEVIQYDVANMIQKSVPAMKTMVKEAVMADLNHWLYRVRETSKLLGQVAFDQTELRRGRQKERVDKSPYFEIFKLNSAVELVLDEREEFDVLDNENVFVDFTPLNECLHIYEALDLRDEFRVIYSETRRNMKELLLPASISFKEDEILALAQVLEEIAGFAIIERATIKRTQNFRSPSDVDELWISMCQKTLNLMTPALSDVRNADTVLKIKAILALFIQTMDTWGYSVELLDGFLLKLFEKYSDLLKEQFTRDFHTIVGSDDYMPMTIASMEEYENIMSVSWYKEDKDRDNLQFPATLPFSQMYPLCCIDVRSFLNKYFFFTKEYFQQHGEIDETLRKSLDEILIDQVCKALVDRLSSNYIGQIVQILINLEHFEFACGELEKLLSEVSASPHSGVIHLKATENFRVEKKTAEKRIFEVVNSKIDDLVEGAEYDWMAKTKQQHPSQYLQAMTQFLTDMMDTTLLSLPKDIKGLIYFDALAHLASEILALPLADEVISINQNAIADLDTDITYLQQFVSRLSSKSENLMLPAVFDELRQTVDLLSSPNPEEFYDISIRMRKYTSVDPLNGPRLMEKLVKEDEIRPKTPGNDKRDRDAPGERKGGGGGGKGSGLLSSVRERGLGSFR